MARGVEGKLNPQQAEYVKNHAVLGMSKRQAAIKAGYAPSSQSSAIEKSGNVQNAMIQALSRRGLTEDKIALKIEEGLNAEYSQYFAFEGIVRDERKSPDYAVRHKYMNSYLELKGYVKNNTIENLNIGLIALPKEDAEDAWMKAEVQEIQETHNYDKSA